MRHLNKLATVFGIAALGLTLTGCEGGDLYQVDSPDWIASVADSIAAAKAASNTQEELEGMEEDVYTIGNPDYSTGWWAAFSKYYQIPDGETWNAVFNLSINPAATNTYKNFALIICNDEDRGAANYKEYGAIRYDNQPSGNSEWGDYIDRSCVESTLTFETDTDAGVEKLGGKVTLTVDRSDPSKFIVKMTNGTVTKTYTGAALPNLNADESNSTIRCFMVPEGSCINFQQSNIEPIGGYTSASDKQPISIELKGVPRKVLVGTELDSAMVNVTANIGFETGVSKTVTAEELLFQAIPDMDQLGAKTLVAVYNKTYKGENCTTPVIAYANFEVVETLSSWKTVGEPDNSTAFWGAHSDYVKVAPYETVITTFTNYTTAANNWNNFVTVLTTEDGSLEYGVFRCDNWGWGTNWVGENMAEVCTSSGGQSDWAAWLAAMDGAKVTVFVTNFGDGTADLKIQMLGTDGVTYYQDYTGIQGIDPDNFFFHFTVDGCHIEFDDCVGAVDNTSGFWSEHSTMFNVPAGQTYTRRFRNYTTGENNWNNFVAVLTNADSSVEYGVFRADNWGWGTNWAGENMAEVCTSSGGQSDWAAWLAAMDGALVTASVTNRGDGTADLNITMLGNDGVTYYQNYTGINTVDAADLNFRFTIDGCHLVFE